MMQSDDSAEDGERGGADDPYRVKSTPENVVWGAIDPTKEPVKTVPSGSTVEMEAISVLVRQKGLSPTEAYRYCSLAVDFNVSQVVDVNKGIHGKIPKSTFDDGFEVDPQKFGEAF